MTPAMLPAAPAGKLVILLAGLAPDDPERCVMPFVYAAVAAAMDCEVEVHFTARAVRLLVDGVAAALDPAHPDGKSVHDHMREAAALGVRFLACSRAARAHVGAGEAWIAEFSGAGDTAGAASFIMRCVDPEWRSLVF